MVLEAANGIRQRAMVVSRAARDAEGLPTGAATLAPRGGLGAWIEGLPADLAQGTLDGLDLSAALLTERVPAKPAAGLTAGRVEQVEDAAEEGVHGR